MKVNVAQAQSCCIVGEFSKRVNYCNIANSSGWNRLWTAYKSVRLHIAVF